MSYSEQEKTRAIAWKKSTTTLPSEAREPASYVNKDGLARGTAYDFCLPRQYADLSLLPEVRSEALELFAELGIPWHAGIDGGPSNHLLSSQVQCVNALAQMVTDPGRIIRALGEVLGIDEVLVIEPGRYLTFEYIGPTDFFGEVPKGQRIRGAHCTSVDAAFLHRAADGLRELVLVEWKYTESYRVRKPDPARDATRLGRYGAAVTDPDGPVRANVLAFEHLLDEPIYQLVRQQLLAHELERAGVADRVRVLHVLSPDNAEYQQSLARPEHRALGETVSEVWRRLLRRPDRFTSVDPALFLDPAITSREYVLRHAPDVVHDEAGLAAALGLDRTMDLEDVLYAQHDLDGGVRVHDEGVEISDVDGSGIGLNFPFTVSELRALADEVAAREG
jgi:hypothetical protein